MSKKTQTTLAPKSPEQTQYEQQQLALGQKQLDYLTEQATQQKDYMASIKPAMDTQNQIWQAQLDQLKAQIPADPAEAAAQAQQQRDFQTSQLKTQQQANDLLQQQLQGQQELAPLQKQLLEAQLKQSLQGNEPTPEQIAQIDAATSAARDAGMSDINAASLQSLQQLRDQLAPQLGLRPTDTPILDRGALVEREATRQAGQLTAALAGANANARLNYPLASQQISQAGSQNEANIGQSTQNFQAQLAQAAATNRLNLLQAGTSSAGLGLQSGLGLANIRGGAVDTSRGSTSVTNDPWGTVVGLVGGVGSALSGTKLFGSDIRLKEDVQTVGYSPRGHRWVRFKYKGDPAKRVHVGVIAHEAAKIDPEVVYTNGLGIKYVDYGKLRA